MTPEMAVVTVASKNYLPRARVLARSLARHHPELRLHLVLSDRVEDCFEPSTECYELIDLERLPIPELERQCFVLSCKQLAVLVKPHALAYLLNRGYSSVMFLDPDMLVLGHLGEVLARVRSHAVVTVPHLLEPLGSQDALARELNVLQCGVRNGGLVGVSDTASARAFLDWWQRRLGRHCEHDVARGVYFDQRWLDLAATMFDDVHTLRDDRMGVAYWRLPEISDQLAQEDWRLVHFSGFDVRDSRHVTRHSARLLSSALSPTVVALFERYRQELMSAGEAHASAWPYAFGRFDNGVRIPAVARRAYARHPGAAECFGNPWRSCGSDSFYHWLTAPVDSSQPPIARVWTLVHAERDDLRRAFPDPVGQQREAFVDWTRSSGRAECGVDERFG